MLVPTILYKNEISTEFKKLYYSEEMMFETGSLAQWCPDIPEIPNEGKFDWAIVHNDKLIGYLSYQVDYYGSCANNFGLVSFERGNPIIGYELFKKLDELASSMHRIEWRMVGGNPAERSYDKFCKKYDGTKHTLTDAIRDSKR